MTKVKLAEATKEINQQAGVILEEAERIRSRSYSEAVAAMKDAGDSSIKEHPLQVITLRESVFPDLPLLSLQAVTFLRLGFG